MSCLLASVMLFAALLADLWVGNYGLTPCLTVYVLFHSSRSVSLGYATVAGLFIGGAIDLIYCRWSSGTPFMVMLSLYAGQLALFRRDESGEARWLSVVAAGAAIGAVLTLYSLATGNFGTSWSGPLVALDLVFGILGGILKLALAVLLLDFLYGYLGLPGFFPPERASGKKSAARSRRRVRAGNVAGRVK